MYVHTPPCQLPSVLIGVLLRHNIAFKRYCSCSSPSTTSFVALLHLAIGVVDLVLLLSRLGSVFSHHVKLKHFLRVVTFLQSFRKSSLGKNLFFQLSFEIPHKSQTQTAGRLWNILHIRKYLQGYHKLLEIRVCLCYTREHQHIIFMYINVCSNNSNKIRVFSWVPVYSQSSLVTGAMHYGSFLGYNFPDKKVYSVLLTVLPLLFS